MSDRKLRTPPHATAETIARVRVYYDQGLPISLISREFELTANQVFQIGKRVAWRSVPDLDDATREQLSQALAAFYPEEVQYFKKNGRRKRSRTHW